MINVLTITPNNDNFRVKFLLNFINTSMNTNMDNIDKENKK